MYDPPSPARQVAPSSQPLTFVPVDPTLFYGKSESSSHKRNRKKGRIAVEMSALKLLKRDSNASDDDPILGTMAAVDETE